MNKKTILITLSIILILVLIILSINLIKPKKDSLTVGLQTSPAMALLMVAKDKGFFEKNNLNVELKEFTAGKFALEAFLSGSLDMSVSGDVPVALAAMNNNNNFIIPAQVVTKTVNEVRVVANKDEKEELNKDAESYFKSKKRKLATSIGGGPEFFTYEFLKSINIGKDEVEIISQAPKDMIASIVSGGVDAVSIFDPVAYFAEKQLGQKGITFKNDKIYSEVYIVSAKKELANTDKLKKFTKALLQAEEYIKSNKIESQKIVAKYTNLDLSAIDGVWNSFEFKVGLTNNLLEYFDREYVWAIDTGKIKKETIKPDFKSLIHKETLKNLNEKSVQIQ